MKETAPFTICPSNLTRQLALQHVDNGTAALCMTIHIEHDSDADTPIVIVFASAFQESINQHVSLDWQIGVITIVIVRHWQGIRCHVAKSFLHRCNTPHRSGFTLPSFRSVVALTGDNIIAVLSHLLRAFQFNDS